MAAESPRDPPSATFLAGSYVFTRGEAVHLARLHQFDGATVRELQWQYHPNATLRQMVVAIQVGIMCKGTLNLAQLNPAIFEPRFVQLGMWKIGKRNNLEE